MTDRELLEQALEWIEAQPEPRMIGADKVIKAICKRLAEPEEAVEPSRPAVRLSDDEVRYFVDDRRVWLGDVRAIEAAVLEKNGLTTGE